MRVIADTNIYVSALEFGGQPKRLLDIARDGLVELRISPPILNEISRILRDKFRWPPEQVEETRALISSFTRPVEPAQELNVVKDDPADNRVLECALASGSRAVISGDRHLLRIGRHEGIEIVKVSDFLSRRQGMQR